jgi:L-alanine-DL-glutamate epimerase-like enolase superfamily enzyme
VLPRLWPFLKGQNALEREFIYGEIKRAQRQSSRIGVAAIDVALWDLAGRLFEQPIHRLLGGWKSSVPCYASTYHADENGGLDTPEAFADYAVQCRDMGYPAFKIHGWGIGPVQREVDNVLAVRKAVGDQMDLMLDPACELRTFADAVKVGHACDDARFYWYEDPFRDGGISQYAHRKLRQLIRTPLLMTEHVRTLEPHIDFALAEATDFVRGDVSYDGITGVIKLAHAAEALGIDIEFHGPGPDKRQCMAAIRNTNYYELGLVAPNAPASNSGGLFQDYSDDLDAIDEKGHVPVPTGPGLGVEIDWDWVKAHETGRQLFD